MLPPSQPAKEKGSLSLGSLRLGLPLVAPLGLEMGILGEKPQELEEPMQWGSLEKEKNGWSGL